MVIRHFQSILKKIWFIKVTKNPIFHQRVLFFYLKFQNKFPFFQFFFKNLQFSFFPQIPIFTQNLPPRIARINFTKSNPANSYGKCSETPFSLQTSIMFFVPNNKPRCANASKSSCGRRIGCFRQNNDRNVMPADHMSTAGVCSVEFRRISGARKLGVPA